MDSIAPPKAIDPLPALAPAQSSEPSPAAEAAARRIAEHAAMLRAELAPDKVEVRLDPDAQRFVQTLTDADTAEMLRCYPSESQLAYSRAVMAYLRAQIGK
ncbi:MAG: hypothetical protein ACT4OF_06560 [Caulobacteraceae bacterium]